jgi:hypothetical protein
LYQNGAVPGGEGDDVGAGDGGAVGVLDGGLDAVDDLVAADGVHVRERGLLAVDDHGHVVQEDRVVAALHEAVVEEEADEGRAHAGVGGHGAAHDGAHDGLQRRAVRGVELQRRAAG